VNKTLNKQVEEKEETPTASGLTRQQEQMYATETQTQMDLMVLLRLHFTFLSFLLINPISCNTHVSVTQGVKTMLQ
jgi:hypothetical protein